MSPTNTETPDSASEIQTVRTAFLVVQLTNGEWRAMDDINAAIKPENPVTVLEMKIGCSEIAYDIEASKISQMVVAQMMAVTEQLKQQAQAQELRTRLKM